MSKHWNPAEPRLEGLSLADLSPDTRATSTRSVNAGTEPLVPPIVHSSTYIIPTVDDYLKILESSGYIYGRLGHPNAEAVECVINALEEGAGTLTFSSGMSAISTALLAYLKAGDHVVCQSPSYSGTFDVISKILSKYGVEATFVSCDVEEFRKSVKSNTRLLYAETPANPTLAILDLEEFGKLGKSLGENVITMVDATFASPFLQQTLKFGIDVCAHSCTKYLGGHSDLTAGCLTFRDVNDWKMLKKYQTSLGVQLSPHEANLLLRGIRTLHVRMPRHCSNAMKVATFLEGHPKVSNVMYPGLTSHPGHAIAKNQMKDFSGMIAVEIKGGREGGKAFVENLRLGQLAVSLGGVETLVSHPATMTHGPMIMSDEERQAQGITDGYVRVSIGIEDPDDLLKDFSQALDKVNI